MIRQFDRLETEIQNACTAGELQNWATNLLAAYPSNASLRVSALGTNFPQQLIKISPRLGPSVSVYEGDTNSAAHVLLYWGSGMMGAKMIEVGPSHFESVRGGKQWQPGVYFVKRGTK